MKHRRTIAALAATTALGLAAPASTASAAGSAERALGERSLAQVLAADGNRFDRNPRDFDIADRAIRTVLKAKPDSLVGVLAQGDQPLTAFVPTDRAFKLLARDLTGKWRASEKKTFKRLAKAVNAATDVSTLEAVLLYHVVPGATITYRQALGADGASLTTAAGSSIKVNVKRHRVWLRDADTSDRNPRVVKKLKNINKGNVQIAHGIDRVLRPLDLP